VVVKKLIFGQTQPETRRCKMSTCVEMIACRASWRDEFSVRSPSLSTQKATSPMEKSYRKNKTGIGKRRVLHESLDTTAESRFATDRQMMIPAILIQRRAPYLLKSLLPVSAQVTQ
jgi:hypothetical protein